MGNENLMGLKSIFSAIKNIVKPMISSASFDVTQLGMVIKPLDGNNKYRVNIKGTDIDVPNATDQIFKAGQAVLVLHPRNSATTYVIIGKG